MRRSGITAFSLVLALASVARGEPTLREWRFEATLDGKPIGTHVFRVRGDGAAAEVDSEASFDVRFLGFPVYRYLHRAKERWQDGCLAELESRTDDNGTVEAVRGERAGEGFAVTGGQSGGTDCTFTFAYWNPRLREQSRLLNPQTGKFLDVRVTSDGTGRIPVGDASVEAQKYLLRGNDLEIALWYDAASGDWLALDSKTSNGSLLSYRLARAPERLAKSGVER